MRNTKEDEINPGEEYDKEEEKQNNKITTNDKNIVLATIQIAEKLEGQKIARG